MGLKLPSWMTGLANDGPATATADPSAVARATDTVVIAGHPIPKTWLYIAAAALLLYLAKRKR